MSVIARTLRFYDRTEVETLILAGLVATGRWPGDMPARMRIEGVTAIVDTQVPPVLVVEPVLLAPEPGHA